MTKCKKMLALLLAVALTLSVSVGPASAALAETAEGTEAVETVSAAEEPTEKEAEAEPAEEEETAELEEKTSEDAEDAEESEAEEVETEAESSAGETEDETAAADDTTDEAESDEDTSEEFEVVFEDAEDETAEENEDAEVSAQSLLPLEEVKAYLVLNGYSDDELSSMSLDTILTMLQDSDGNSIEISSSATTVWKYVKDDTDGIEVYEEYTIGNGETIDLTGYENATDYQLELIVGSDGQLNAGNIRYIIKVYVSSQYSEEFEFRLYSQEDNSTRTRIYPKREQFVQSDSTIQASGGVYIPMWSYAYYVEEGDYVSPYLCATSELEEHPSISLKIYELSAYLSGDYTEVTDDLLTDTPTENYAGYKMTSTSASFLVFYYLDEVQVDVLVLTFLMTAGASEFTGDLYTVEVGTQVSVVDDIDYSFGMTSDLEFYFFELKSGYEADAEYYLTLDAISGTDGNVNDKIEKAVVGEYDSLEDASEQEDIKESLFSDEGYQANYSDGIEFTIFFIDDTRPSRKLCKPPSRSKIDVADGGNERWQRKNAVRKKMRGEQRSANYWSWPM